MMDSKFYWILNNLISLINLTEHGSNYSIYHLDFTKKEIGINGAYRLAKDLGVADRVSIRPESTNPDWVWVLFDYHGTTIKDYCRKEMIDNAEV